MENFVLFTMRMTDEKFSLFILGMYDVLFGNLQIHLLFSTATNVRYPEYFRSN